MLRAKCTNRIEIQFSTQTSKLIPETKSFDVNRRFVKAFLSNGEGFASLERFCLVLNMDKMSSRTFSAHTGGISKATSNIGYKCLEKARARVREIPTENNCDINDGSIFDVSVSYDGRWHKRGHTSNYGIGVVIEIDRLSCLLRCRPTVNVLRRMCLYGTELGVQSPEFDIWFQGHKTNSCKNYTGFSASMETKAAEILWERSLDYKMRYRTIISDGDSAVFT